jgi:hypothetical protein
MKLSARDRIEKAGNYLGSINRLYALFKILLKIRFRYAPVFSNDP